jgi:hypothetical protein
MDLPVTAVASYSSMQESYLQQSAVAAQRQVTAQQRIETATSNNDRTQRQDQSDPRRESERLARDAAVARQAKAESVRAPGFKFDYEDTTRVMKVQDSKAVLIYQVPTKGQLAILEAAERIASRIQVTV